MKNTKSNSLKLLATSPSVYHVKCPLWLIIWNHMSGITNQHMSKFLYSFRVPCQLVYNMPKSNKIVNGEQRANFIYIYILFLVKLLLRSIKPYHLSLVALRYFFDPLHFNDLTKFSVSGHPTITSSWPLYINTLQMQYK